ncbi:putative capsid protein [Pacific flying fox faeces associated circular DNA virus-14]|nr:putative capsid protein [Pacific flying fox faeces associated circular DNA virus-14]
MNSNFNYFLENYKLSGKLLYINPQLFQVFMMSGIPTNPNKYRKREYSTISSRNYSNEQEDDYQCLYFNFRRQYSKYRNRFPRSYGAYTRRAVNVRGLSYPTGVRGFWPGRRSTFRRITQNVRTPSNRIVRMTYSVPEKKFIDVTGTYAVTAAGDLTLLNGLTQGVSVISRVGNKIMMRSLDLRWRLTGAPFSATPTLPFNMVRVMLVWDAQPNGVIASAGDILQDTTPGTGVVSPQQRDYIQRFRIIMDRKFTLTNLVANNGPTDIIIACDQMYKKTKLMVTYSDSNTGLIDDISTGALYLVTVGLHAAAANQGVIEYFSRVRYYDN